MKFVLTVLLSLFLHGQAAGQSLQPVRIFVNDVELHYIEQGQGEPLILLHGGMGDYRSWGLRSRRYLNTIASSLTAAATIIRIIIHSLQKIIQHMLKQMT
jgi:hypothetical protein